MHYPSIKIHDCAHPSLNSLSQSLSSSTLSLFPFSLLFACFADIQQSFTSSDQFLLKDREILRRCIASSNQLSETPPRFQPHFRFFSDFTTLLVSVRYSCVLKRIIAMVACFSNSQYVFPFTFLYFSILFLGFVFWVLEI